MIKAIETQYKGYRFRSRLEARWAVFFDALCLRWEYEPEGFDLGEFGWYLPDFYLPDWDVWIEVKPDIPAYEDLLRFTAFHMAKAADEIKESGKRRFKASYIICGTPGVPKLELGESLGQWKLVSGSIALHPLTHKITGLLPSGFCSSEVVSPLNTDAEFRCFVEAFAFTNGGRELDIWPIYLQETDGHPMMTNMIKQNPNMFGDKVKHFIGLEFPQGISLRTYGGKGISYDNINLRAAYNAARSARFEHGESPLLQPKKP